MSEKAVASSALLGLASNDITLAFTLLFCARMIGNSVRVAATTATRKYIVKLVSAILGKGMRLQDWARFRCTSVLGLHACEGIYAFFDCRAGAGNLDWLDRNEVGLRG